MGQAIVPRTLGSRSSTASAAQGGQRFSATVVLLFIVASTAISIYDLFLLIKLVVL